MEIISLPKPLGSVFVPQCIELENVVAPDGLDIEIRDLDTNELIGVKRIYSAEKTSVNIAPYLRARLAIHPLSDLPTSGPDTIVIPAERMAGCAVVMNGIRTQLGRFTGGTVAVTMGKIMSDAPGNRKIAPGERDEISYTGVDNKMRVWVVEAGEEDFEVEGPGIGKVNYLVDKTGGGIRLAWVNRYGAVDYHTFPFLDKSSLEGSRTLLETHDGVYTTRTSAMKRLALVSEPMDKAGAEWLAGLLSSPAVWMMDGATSTPVEVAGGTIETSPDRPTTVKVTIVPENRTISRV